jgi:alginate O-acetyltransferase complex protein AlgI
MLFNSYEFIFVFLPLALFSYFALGPRRQTAAQVTLIAASLFFYSRAASIWILIASLIFNWTVYRAIRFDTLGRDSRKTCLWFGIGGNLLYLAYFKYLDFLINSLNTVLAIHIPPAAIELPPGISFFTFTQIMFLVDAYRYQASEPKFPSYALFVSYFPHLIAGPLLHHRDIMPQFARRETYRLDLDKLATGLTLFLFGLFKKVVIADTFAQYVEPVFKAADGHQPVAFADAWCGVLAFTFQLYFDFSAYSDMAVGLGVMFGVRMPANFYSPYAAVNIVDFWRRWHMTLSRFLRDYLYIPLGGNRHGSARRYFNVMTTMALGGLWHGANWTFVIWGALHGIYLVIARLWQSMTRSPQKKSSASPAWSMASWALTFLAVMFAWVFFRARTLQGAGTLLSAMLDVPGLAPLQQVPKSAPALLVCALLVCLFAPNTLDIMVLRRPALGVPVGPAVRRRRRRWARLGLVWRPNLGWAAIVTLVSLASFYVMFSRTTEIQFLYYQF